MNFGQAMKRFRRTSRKERILKMFKNDKVDFTCQEITKKIIKAEKLTGNKALYLSGSISTILAKLVKEGILIYGNGTGPKGGHLYQKRSV